METSTRHSEHERRVALLGARDGAHRRAAAAALARARDAFASRAGLLVSMSEGAGDLSPRNSRDAAARAASVLRW